MAGGFPPYVAALPAASSPFPAIAVGLGTSNGPNLTYEES
jgi:hypothetical protein